MKKVAILMALVSMMFAAPLAFAADSGRLNELQAEQAKLIEQYNQLVGEQQKIQIRLIEIQGALKELAGDKGATKAEAKK